MSGPRFTTANFKRIANEQSSTSGQMTNIHKLTAAEINEDCPAKLQDLAKRISAHLEKARKYEEKADQHYTAVSQYLVNARDVCDEGGFSAFRKKFFPELGRSRVYELLSIATSKKSVDEIKANTRARVAKHRANNPASSVTVTDKAASEPEEPVGNTAAEPRSAVTPKDEALIGFSAIVAELLRRIRKREPERFARTSIPVDDLAKIGKFFMDLADLKKSVVKPIDLVGNGSVATTHSAGVITNLEAPVDVAA